MNSYLLKIKTLFWQDYHPLNEGNKKSRIVKTFKKNLEKHYRDLAHNQVDKIFQSQDYARLQQLNSSYFSQVIKSKTNRSPTEWITERTLSYAKALLLRSTLSIKEIAYKAGFSDPAYFSNYFKKNTGQSPSSFRRQKSR